MKTRNIITVLALGLIATFAAGFVTEASAGSSRFGDKRRVEVREKYERRGGDSGYRYERVEVRRGGRDRHEARWEGRDRHRDRDRWEHRNGHHDRWEHRNRHRSHYRDHDYCDRPSHRHWRRHRHDHDGHVHFFLGLGLEHGSIFLGLR